MAKVKKNAVSSALASLRGKKKPAKAVKPAKPVGKVKAPKAKPVLKAKKSVKPQLVHKPKVATAGTPVTPLPVKPVADVYSLVHQCWKLWSSGPHPMDAEQQSEFGAIAAVVSAYGDKLCVPTVHAREKLESFRRFLAGEKEPEPVPEPQKAAKPWEPCPEAVQRLIAGECEPGRGVWILHGTLWEFETGWAEPRRMENTQPEDWATTGVTSLVTPLMPPAVESVTPEGETNEVKPVDPQPEPEAVTEAIEVKAEAEAAEFAAEQSAEPAAVTSGDVDL